MNSRMVFLIKKWKTPCSCGLKGKPTEDERLNYSKENHCKPAMAKMCITRYSEQTSKFIHMDCEKEDVERFSSLLLWILQCEGSLYSLNTCVGSPTKKASRRSQAHAASRMSGTSPRSRLEVLKRARYASTLLSSSVRCCLC